jgi:hypothetical protein
VRAVHRASWAAYGPRGRAMRGTHVGAWCRLSTKQAVTYAARRWCLGAGRSRGAPWVGREGGWISAAATWKLEVGYWGAGSGRGGRTTWDEGGGGGAGAAQELSGAARGGKEGADSLFLLLFDI